MPGVLVEAAGEAGIDHRLVVVALNDPAAGAHHEIEASIWMRAVADDVAQADELVHAARRHGAEGGFERREITVNV